VGGRRRERRKREKEGRERGKIANLELALVRSMGDGGNLILLFAMKINFSPQYLLSNLECEKRLTINWGGSMVGTCVVRLRVLRVCACCSGSVGVLRVMCVLRVERCA
jgi:hypothetical protein